MKNKFPLHMIGNAHLDPVWLWQWQEGFAEIKATFRSALDRLKEFPEFVFTCAGAAYYRWVEENAPEMFEEIRMRVSEGRWVITGGWWIQPDCNLPSGESFVRQALYSQRYFLEKFGKLADVGYNVDSFGHNGALPQILKKSGLNYYVFGRPDANEKTLPSDLFWWEGPDGTRVLAYRLLMSYGMWGCKLEEKIGKHAEWMKDSSFPLMCFYGVGNHGGGPTIENLRLMRKYRAEAEGVPLQCSSPTQYFETLRSLDTSRLPVVRDDLQPHAIGCYSAHAETKALNRASEHRLLSAEKFSALAHKLLGLPYPEGKLRTAWENVLFNQFHDIMGGCSIKEAYEDSRESYGEALHIGAKALNAALQKISWSIDTMKPGVEALSKEKDWMLWEQGDLGVPVVVFNPLSWEVDAPVKITKQVKAITDDEDRHIPIQQVRASRTNGADKWDTMFMARIPAMGYRVYWAYLDREPAHTPLPGELQAEDTFLENANVRLEIDPATGYIKRLLHKGANLEVFEGDGAVPIVIDEEESDTWGHNLTAYRKEKGKFGEASAKVIERGPLRAVIRVTSRYRQSTLQMDYILYRDASSIRVEAWLDWRERHSMLKLSFPVSLDRTRAVSEIPYAFLEREADGKEKPGQQWVDLTGVSADGRARPFGFALLNTNKYAYDVLDRDLRLTVVRSPQFADHYGERDEFAPYMDQGEHHFTLELVPHEGDWRGAAVVRKAFELNVPPVTIVETYHRGPLPQRYVGLRITSEQVVATAYKLAEDGEGYILRAYETAGQAAETEFELASLGRRWTASFIGCEIKTFYIPIDEAETVRETNLIEFAVDTDRPVH